jgi:hypothetical protein
MGSVCVTGTRVSQLSETGQGIMCVKEDIGKYDMWYGVVCKDVMSSTLVVFSHAIGRDTVPFVPYLVITTKKNPTLVPYQKVFIPITNI